MGERAGLTLYPENKLCPCGSGLIYGDCCKAKNFRFEIDKKGVILRSLDISPQLKCHLDGTLRDFKKMFGRNASKSDPVIFEQFLSSPGDFWQQVHDAARCADLREELIFAWRRSGFLVGEHSRELMPDSDYEEWEEEIEEYFDLKEFGYDPFFVFTYLSGEEYEIYKNIVKLLDEVIIVVGLSISNAKRSKDGAGYFRLLLAERSIKSLRTIREMYKSRYDDDCLSIVRAVYEAYLRMKFLRLDPASSERFEASIAYEAGLYETKIRPNGRHDYNICVDPSTGKEYKISISNQEIIKISDLEIEEGLYYELYPILSEHVHPGLAEIFKKSLGEARNDSENDGDPIRAMVIILTVCTLFLEELSRSNFLISIRRRDVLYVRKKILKNIPVLICSPAILARMNKLQALYQVFGLKIIPREK